MRLVPEIVFLHGFSNTGASWAPVIAGLGERYRPTAPDIRGHGSRADVEPVTLAAVLQDLAGTAPDRFTLCGYSQGGRIALHAALALPTRVQRLVLIGASPGLADDVARAERRAADERLADELVEMSIEQFAARWATTPVLAGLEADVAAAAHEDRLRNTPEGLARALRGLGTGALPPTWDRLGELRMPVVLMAGERDTKFIALAREMASRIPNSEVVTVPGAGHAVHLERPHAVVSALVPLE
jgi:2-succinyl-6-hydroxy-2,4-cyclohexadiene-1-carboxylate synthase